MGEGEDENPLLGLDFVSEVSTKRIDEQIKLIEAIDLKMSVLVGFLGTLIVGMLAGLLAVDISRIASLFSWTSKIGIGIAMGCVAFALVTAFQAFRTRQYHTHVSIEDLIPWANENPKVIKEVFLPTLVEAIRRNDRQVTAKTKNASRAVWSTFLAILSLLFALADFVFRMFRWRL